LERATNDSVNAQMKAAILLMLALIGGCSSGAQADLSTIKEMRSVAAEWATVNREAARGHLMTAYVAGMRKAAREQIAKQAQTLTKGSAAADAAAALQALPLDAAPERIEGVAAALKQIEAKLESA
jgi:hypothetical protein